MRGSLFLIALISGLFSLDAAPQVFYLDSGERLVGELQPASTDQVIVLKSALLGKLSLPRARVVKIETQAVVAQASSLVALPAQSSVAENAAVPVVPEGEPVAVPPETEAESSVGGFVTLQEYLALQNAKKWFNSFTELETPNYWNGDLRIGLNVSDGDSKWTENYLRGKLEIEPIGGPNFYRITGEYLYRKTEQRNGEVVKSTDRYNGEFVYRRTFSEDWFMQNSVSVRVDQIKGIDRDLQASIGLGYKYKVGKKIELLFGAGGGLRSLQSEFQDNYLGDSAVVNVFQELNWNFTKRFKFIQNFDYNQNPEISEQYSYILSARLSFRFTDLLGYEFSFNKDYDNDVGNGDPKEDVRWQNALVVYF